MKLISKTFTVLALLALASCTNKNGKHDASGTFEVNEVVVSSSANGKLLQFHVEEGSIVAADSIIGIVDPSLLGLQREEVQAAREALTQQTLNVNPQVQLLQDQLSVQQSQLNNLIHEKARIVNLLKQDAATGKQLDDLNAQIDMVEKQMAVTKQQIAVQQNNTGTQNRAILSQDKPLGKKEAQLSNQLDKTNIRNPISGTVITKYAEQGEITAVGKALYKIADLSVMTLRAYISGTQLPEVKLGQVVKVYIDDGPDQYKELSGTVTWISDKAEFTPKTIQTKEERANLVYAVKIKVPNKEGLLKIGMYGEVQFK